MCNSVKDIVDVPTQWEIGFNNLLISQCNKEGCEGYAWRALAEVAYIVEFAINLLLLPLTLPFLAIGLLLAGISFLGDVKELKDAVDLLITPYSNCMRALGKLGEAIVLNPFVKEQEELTDNNLGLNYGCCGAATAINSAYSTMHKGETAMINAILSERNVASGFSGFGMRLLAELAFFALFLVHLALSAITLPFFILFFPQMDTEWGKVLAHPAQFCLMSLKQYATLLVTNLYQDTVTAKQMV